MPSEPPVWCGYSPAFHCHAPVAAMLGPALIRHQVVEVCQPWETRLLAATGMLEPVHREPLPRNGVVGLIQHGAGGGPLRVGEDRRPACLLVLTPASPALPVGRPRRVGDVVRKAPSPLAQRTQAHALPRPRPVPPGGERRAQGPTDRRGDGCQLLGQLHERVAPAVAETRPRAQCPQTRGGAVNASGQDAPDLRGRLVTGRGALQLAIGLGQGRRTGLRGVAERPDHATTDERRAVHAGCQTVPVRLIGQDIGGQWQTAPRQPHHYTLVPERTHHALAGHRRDMPPHGTPRQTEAPRCGQQGVAGHLRAPRAITSDDVGQDRDHRCAGRALETPAGDTRQPDTHRRRLAGQTPAPTPARLVLQLTAKGHDAGHDTGEKRLAVATHLEGGRFARKIDGDGAVFPWWFGGATPGSPPGQMVCTTHDTPWGSPRTISRASRRDQGVTTKSDGM